MRKFAAVFTALAIIFALCSCSAEEQEKERDCGVYITVEADDVYTVSYGTDEDSGSVTNADESEPLPVGDVIHFDFAGEAAEKDADCVIDYSICVYDKDMEVLATASFSDNFGNMAKIEIVVTEDHHILHSGESISCGGDLIVDIASSAPETGISLETPTVSLADREDAETAINAAIAELNTAFVGSEKDAYKTAYDTNYAAAEAGATKSDFSMSRTVRAMRGDSVLLSFRMVDRASLATESVLKIFGVTYDTETGSEVKFSDLSDDVEGLRSFCAEYVLIATTEEARFKNENMVFNTGYTDTLSSLVSDGHWYFSDEGMVIAANPGEIAPVSSGHIEFVIPYSELEGKLSDRFMPLEHDGEYGSVSAVANAQDGAFVTVGEALDESALSLTVVGNVYDLSVYTAKYNSASGTYTLLSQLRYCSDISRGGAFPLNVELDSSPNVYVGYSTADGVRHNRLISMGSNGLPVLIDPDGDDMGLLINSGYVCDLVADGKNASVEFESGKLTVSSGDDVFEIETPVVIDATLMLYDIDGDCEFEIFIFGGDNTGKPTSCGYKLDGELYEILNASGAIYRFNGNRVTVGNNFEFAGTLPLILNYGCSYAEDGTLSLVAASSSYAFDGETKLTLKTDLTVGGVLSKAGTELTLKSTDAESFIDCVNADGSSFRLNISKADDGSWMIGDILVSTLF